MKRKKTARIGLNPFPADQNEAVRWLLTLVRAAESKTLGEASAIDFVRGWYSVGFLYAGLHPDSALEHGAELSNNTEDNPEIRKVEPRLLAPYYVQSGWPVLLAPVAKEAWRRYEAKELEEDEFYCSEAVVAGMCYRNPGLIAQLRHDRKSISL